MYSKKCFKFQHESLDNLNVVYNTPNRTIVFWNQYEMFFFDEIKYEILSKSCQCIFLTEFKIAQVILTSNYIICLDHCGYVYVTSLKFETSAHKIINNECKHESDKIICMNYHDELTFSIQKDTEAKKLYFCIHKIDQMFKRQNRIEISQDNIQNPNYITHEKLIFSTYKLNENQYLNIKDIFQSKGPFNNQMIIIFTFDNLTLYALLVTFKQLQQCKLLHPITLLTCPTKINNVSYIIDNSLCIIISLSSGTLIKLSLNSEYKSPKTVHLNTAIHKLIAYNDTMIYTDGITMWKSENTFLEDNITFREFTVKHVKDFIRVEDEIICITYSKFIYFISIEDKTSYHELQTTNEYSSSEHLLNNLEYYNKIIDEIDKNDHIIKKIKMEENYITTLALSNRQDIMDDVINYNIIVFENYEDILKQDISLTIPNSVEEYFDIESFYLLIKISTTCHLQQKFSNILSNVFGNLKIHVTVLSEQKVIKTTSIQVQEQLKNINIVIPLKVQMLNLTNITVTIKLVTLIPGALNEKETLGVSLHYNKIVLNSEHFIKSSHSKLNIQFLKEPKKSIVELIYESACNHHGHLFKITKDSDEHRLKWPFFVKLLHNYQKSLSNKAYFYDNFNTRLANYLFNEISSEEFLKSRSILSFVIANEKVEVELLNDGFSDPLLRVTSQNSQVALSVRNFLSNLAHNNFKNYETGYVSKVIYELIEDIEKLMVKEISNENFMYLFEQYQKKIIGAIII